MDRPITGNVVRARIDFHDDDDDLYLDRDQSIMDNFTTTGLLFPRSSLDVSNEINPFRYTRYNLIFLSNYLPPIFPFPKTRFLRFDT